MNVKLLIEQYLEFLSLTGGCTGSSESTLVKIPHCWKSHVTAHLYNETQENGDTIWRRKQKMVLTEKSELWFLTR